MGFPAKLLGEDETVVMLLRPHVKRLFLPVLVLLVVAPLGTFAAAVVPAGGVQGWARGLIAAAALLVLLRWTIVPFVVWWNTRYVITDRRLVMRHGVLTRSGHDMPLSRLNDVSFQHNLFDRIIGCGTLTVESAGERGQVVLADVPRVEQVQRVLYRLSDQLRQPDQARYPGADLLADPLADGADDVDRHPDAVLHDPDDPAGAPDDGDARPERWGRRRR
jgi:uncharacterized membrane protein YdbT with pleckstrin-like domain